MTSITLTNGQDYIYFGQKKDEGKEPINIQENVQTVEEQHEEELNIPGLIHTETTSQKMIKYGYKKQYLTLKVAPTITDYFILLFLSFYYGYSQKTFTIKERSATKIEYSIVEKIEEITEVQREQYYQLFMQDYILFDKFCQNVQDIRGMTIKTLKTYSIKNNITDYKEIFDSVYTFQQSVLMCQLDETFKGSKNYISKNFSVFPYLGRNTLGFLVQRDNTIQCQIVNYDKLYVIDVFNQNKDIIPLNNQYMLPIDVKKLESTQYQVLINFEMKQQFIKPFMFMKPRKQSNTQYYINIGKQTLTLTKRHLMIQCSGKFDNIYESAIYFTIIANIGGFKVNAYQQPTLQQLQYINPLYFGKSEVGNYEKQLENMNKRPLTTFMNFFDGKYPDWLKKFVVKPEVGKSDVVKIENPKDNMSLTKINILTNINQKRDVNLEDDCRFNVYMEFTCPQQYPYVSITRSQQNSDSIIYYIGCQVTPITLSSINLYDMYDSFKRVLYKNDEYLEKLHKSLFGKVSLSPIRTKNLYNIPEGRCCNIPTQLQKIIDPKLLMIKLLDDKEWINSVFENFLDYNRLVYNYDQQYFSQFIINDKQQFTVYVEDQQLSMNNLGYVYVVVQPELSKNGKYQPYIYEGKLYNDLQIKVYNNSGFKHTEYIFTEFGIMPRRYYDSYKYIFTESSKKPFFPSKKFVDALNLNATACIINVDQKAIGYKTEEFNIYFEASPIPQDMSLVIGSYPQNMEKLYFMPTVKYMAFQPTIEQIARVLITTNRQHIVDGTYGKLWYQKTKEKSKVRLYNNMIDFTAAYFTESDVKEAVEYIKTLVPSDKEQREIYVRNINTYITPTDELEYNFDDVTEKVEKISAYLQATDDIFL